MSELVAGNFDQIIGLQKTGHEDLCGRAAAVRSHFSDRFPNTM